MTRRASIGGWAHRVCRNFWRRFGLIARALLSRPGLNALALLAMIAGSGILTGLLGWGMGALITAKQWDPVAFLAYGLLGTVAMVIFSMGKLLAGKQAIELEFWKIKAKIEQGDEDDDSGPGPTKTTTTTPPA